MNRQEATEYLEDSGFEEDHILDVKEGEHNRNFIFDSRSGKKVLRKNNSGSSGELKHERNILRFIESKGLNFAPGTFHFNEEQDVLVIEYVGEQARLEELEKPELEEWVSKIAELHRLEYEEYREFCRENGFEAKPYETRLENFEKLTEKRLKNAKEVLQNHELLEYAEEKVEETKKEMEDAEFSRSGLIHADLANSTHRSGELNLIDWEFSRFTDGPEIELTKVWINGEVGDERFEAIKELYCEETGLKRSGLEKGLKSELVLQITWLLERAAELKNEDGDWEKYLDLAKEKKEKLENHEA